MQNRIAILALLGLSTVEASQSVQVKAANIKKPEQQKMMA
jgi:hypothetical protein